LCVGVEYGKGKREGQIAKLKFSYKGSVFSADLGKGWTDERRKALTSQYEALEHPAALSEWNPIGKIWEVKALQESSTGKALRLPKVIRVREDKEKPDA
ncbi:ATP-dependent DNA ligase, partial [Acinetobacter phage vB_AbaP_ABW132]